MKLRSTRAPGAAPQVGSVAAGAYTALCSCSALVSSRLCRPRSGSLLQPQPAIRNRCGRLRTQVRGGAGGRASAGHGACAAGNGQRWGDLAAQRDVARGSSACQQGPGQRGLPPHPVPGIACLPEPRRARSAASRCLPGRQRTPRIKGWCSGLWCPCPGRRPSPNPASSPRERRGHAHPGAAGRGRRGAVPGPDQCGEGSDARRRQGRSE